MISCSAGGETFRPSLNAMDIRAACPTQKANNGGLEVGQSPLIVIFNFLTVLQSISCLTTEAEQDPVLDIIS